jgi:hypothetical protein
MKNLTKTSLKSIFSFGDMEESYLIIDRSKTPLAISVPEQLFDKLRKEDNELKSQLGEDLKGWMQMSLTDISLPLSHINEESYPYKAVGIHHKGKTRCVLLGLKWRDSVEKLVK